MENRDDSVVEAFGQEWATFDQSGSSAEELQRTFDSYFAIFPWHELPPTPRGFDLGCGSGRWARIVAARVAEIHCVDASVDALEVAQRNLAGIPNAVFHHASVDAIPIPDSSMDFGYSLGVLHHVPNTSAGLAECVRKLRPGAPFLLYLYYAFDNRPQWFRMIWRASDLLRRVISKLPFGFKRLCCEITAALVYWPLARFAALGEWGGREVENWPLAAYRRKSFYMMRNDSLDRFGTALEQRFTRPEIERMMLTAGLERIRFSPEVPYWCALGYRR